MSSLAIDPVELLCVDTGRISAALAVEFMATHLRRGGHLVCVCPLPHDTSPDDALASRCTWIYRRASSQRTRHDPLCRARYRASTFLGVPSDLLTRMIRYTHELRTVQRTHDEPTRPSASCFGCTFTPAHDALYGKLALWRRATSEFVKHAQK